MMDEIDYRLEVEQMQHEKRLAYLKEYYDATRDTQLFKRKVKRNRVPWRKILDMPWLAREYFMSDYLE